MTYSITSNHHLICYFTQVDIPIPIMGMGIIMVGMGWDMDVNGRDGWEWGQNK